VLTHNYTGYPMVRQAREMVAKGDLGDIRVVQAEYAQDWLTEKAEATGSKQAEWRTDPKRSGAGGATGDIGTHAYNLARFVTGLELDSLAADLDAFVDGRLVDDNAHVLLRFKPRAAPRACFGQARSRPATRTRSACASTAPRAGWNGRRSTPTISGTRPSANPSA
jgi:predicted dehydrogenase